MMCEIPEHAEGDRELTCSGIWGGVHNLDREVRAGGLVASLYSSSCDGGKGGDIYYIAVCVGDTLTRVAIADVVGHGQAVSNVSQYVYESLKAHMCDPDSGKILSALNRIASRQGLEAMTTAAVVAYDAAKGTLYVSYAGHPPFLLKRAKETAWSFVPRNNSDEGDGPGMNLPLAVAPGAVYSQQVISVTSRDRLFVYTDGVTEAPNLGRELFGTERLRSVLDAYADASLSELKSAVLRALRQHTGNGLSHDDVTLMVMEVR